MKPLSQLVRRNILALAERLRQSTSGGPRGQLVEVQGVPLILVMSEISNNQNSLPSAGTLVLSISAELPHEVLPATRERLSLTGWFRRR